MYTQWHTTVNHVGKPIDQVKSYDHWVRRMEYFLNWHYVIPNSKMMMLNYVNIEILYEIL